MANSRKDFILAMQLTSPVFQNNQSIPEKYTCDGANINPALKFGAVPIAAKSLVLIMDDPDAPSGDFVHWTIWNISPKVLEIAENSVPAGCQQGLTDFGNRGYGGPCPHKGLHHYQFKLYALDADLQLNPLARKGDIEGAMSGHILEQALLVGLYQRK